MTEPSPEGETLDAPKSETPGGRIGPYRLLEQIGQGGFGVVFVAEQEHPVRRRVALAKSRESSARWTRRGRAHG